MDASSEKLIRKPVKLIAQSRSMMGFREINKGDLKGDIYVSLRAMREMHRKELQENST